MNRHNRSTFDFIENVVLPTIAMIGLVTMLFGVLAAQWYCIGHPAVG